MKNFSMVIYLNYTIGYSKFLNQEDATIEVDKIFHIHDIDIHGKIDYTEFIIATINK